MKRTTFSLIAFLVLTAAAGAQNEELKFNKQQAEKLHKFAETAFKAGFPLNAKRVWLMILSEYWSDHPGARKALGYQRAGESWTLNPRFVYPKNDSPDVRKAKSLRAKWLSLAKSIAAAHRRMARKYAKAGRPDRAKYHYKKVLFYLSDDKEATEALKYKPVAGLSGTDLEMTLYKRSKKIERAVAEECRKDYPVETLPSTNTNPLLEQAKVQYTSVKSEHFTIRGDFEADVLMKAAKNAERALRVMDVAYDGYNGFNKDPNRWLRDWAFFKDKDTYKQILKANANLIDPKDLQFRLEHTSGSIIASQQAAIRVNAAGNEAGIYDGAVRNVAQTYSGFRSDALREGIGHTFVGMFFNNNRQFVVDRRRQIGSVSSEEDLEQYSPNFDTWKELALEAAWKLGEGTPASRLPVIQAAKFPDDARIKSWSFCDYMMRRDPSMLQDMDRLRTLPNGYAVETKFTEAHNKLSIAQLDKEWKDFWTEASPVLRAIRNNQAPFTSVSKGVKKWLNEFNDERKRLNATEVTWSESYSRRCRDHVEYLIANKDERGPAKEQQQNIDLEGGTHLGSMFAEMALVGTKVRKPKDLFEDWLSYPGYRDALLNSGLRTVGLYIEKHILVMDCIRGVGKPPDEKKGYVVYPFKGARAIPSEVKVADLGPELEALLAKNGIKGKKVLGYPLTLHHFGTGGVAGKRNSYQCSVTMRGEQVKGILDVADGGSNRHTSAPGLVVFYPLEPFKRGAEVDVVWTFEHDQGTSRTSANFIVR